MTVNIDLDDTDVSIVEALQRDGRIKLTELSEEVGLGVSATRVRLQNLEKARVIVGYTACIDPTALGYSIRAISQLDVAGRRTAEVEAVIDGIPEVVRCSHVTGQSCYIMDIVATSMPDLERIVEQLCALGSVTTDVVYRVVRDRQLPSRREPTA